MLRVLSRRVQQHTFRLLLWFWGWCKNMKQGDKWLLIIIITVGGLSLLFYFHNSIQAERFSGDTYARIELNGQWYKDISLSSSEREIEIVTPRGYDLIRVSANGVQVIESDCPDKICMSYGMINKVGQMIICLPIRMVIEIKGVRNEPQEIDFIVY